MWRRVARNLDEWQLAFVAYVSIIAGIIVLLIYGRDELRTAGTLTGVGLALAGVHLYIRRRRDASGQAREDRPAAEDQGKRG